MTKIISDFENYLDKLKEIIYPGNKADLEKFYQENSSIIQFFKTIDTYVQDNLSKIEVDANVLKQLEAALTTLINLKRVISSINVDNLHISCKNEIFKIINYIKDEILVDDADNAYKKLLDLLKKNAPQNKEQKKQEQQRKRKIADLSCQAKNYIDAKNYKEALACYHEILRWLQSKEWARRGLCRYCGGKLNLERTKCTICGCKN